MASASAPVGSSPQAATSTAPAGATPAYSASGRRPSRGTTAPRIGHEGVGGVQGRAAVEPAVRVGARRAHAHAAVHQAADAGADRGAPGADHHAVEDDHGGRGLGVGLQVVERGGAAALLLPLHDERGAHRQPSLRRQPLHGGEQHEEVALVVARAPRVEGAVAHRGLERRRGPQLVGAGRLDVVVPVQHHPGRLRIPRAGRYLPHHQRVAGRGADLRGAAGPAHLLGDEVSRPPHVGGMGGDGADARHPQERVQPVDLLGAHRPECTSRPAPRTRPPGGGVAQPPQRRGG